MNLNPMESVHKNPSNEAEVGTKNEQVNFDDGTEKIKEQIEKNSTEYEQSLALVKSINSEVDSAKKSLQQLFETPAFNQGQEESGQFKYRRDKAFALLLKPILDRSSMSEVKSYSPDDINRTLQDFARDYQFNKMMGVDKPIVDAHLEKIKNSLDLLVEKIGEAVDTVTKSGEVKASFVGPSGEVDFEKFVLLLNEKKPKNIGDVDIRVDAQFGGRIYTEGSRQEIVKTIQQSIEAYKSAGSENSKKYVEGLKMALEIVNKPFADTSDEIAKEGFAFDNNLHTLSKNHLVNPIKSDLNVTNFNELTEKVNNSFKRETTTSKDDAVKLATAYKQAAEGLNKQVTETGVLV
jgi:hypothetical protein